jgi:hypothetical protein
MLRAALSARPCAISVGLEDLRRFESILRPVSKLFMGVCRVRFHPDGSLFLIKFCDLGGGAVKICSQKKERANALH